MGRKSTGGRDEAAEVKDKSSANVGSRASRMGSIASFRT